MKKEFIHAIETGDIITVRLFLSNELLLNPHSSSFHEMKKYAEKQLTNLYVDNDGSLPETEWANPSMNNLLELKNELDSNFSRERLDLYEKVAQKVLAGKKEPLKLKQEESLHKENTMLTTTLIAGAGILLYGAIKTSVMTSAIGIAASAYSATKLIKNKKNGQ